MKKILTIFTFLICSASIAFAQYDILDFESSAGGTGLTWTVDQNGTNPALTFPANPVSGGINTSATVAEFTAEVAGQRWALTYTTVGAFEFNATNSTIKIKVYKDKISDVGIKVEGGSSGFKEILVANTVTNQWEELTFDFSSEIGNNYAQLVIIPDFIPDGTTRPSDATIYFDDIQIPTANYTPPSGPTVAAATPTHTVGGDNVLSIYSDAYTDVTGTDFNPVWGQGTVQSFTTAASDNIIKYAGLDYQGTQLAPGQDVSGHGYFHLDYYTDDATALAFFLINVGASPVEKSYSIPTITTGQWVSVDIPINHFVDLGLDVTDINQFKVTGNGTVYFDNWYFHSTYFASAPTGPTTAAPTPTHTVVGDGVVAIYSNAYTPITGINYNPGWGQATTKTDVTIAGNDAMKYGGLNYQGTDWNGNPQDLSDNTGLPAPGYTYYLHIDYWANTTITAPDVTIVSGVWPNNKEYFIPFSSFSAETWNSVDIPLSDFHNGNTDIDLSDIRQINIRSGGGTGSGDMWIDNIYFYRSTAVAVPVELSSFTGKAQGNTNALAWETASELNNSHFEVERSANGVDFEVIGTVQGQGTTFEVANYDFIDEAPAMNSYYRLRQVDFDGAFEYSDVINVVRRQMGSNDVTLYPNPVRNNLTVDYVSTTEGEVMVTVTDVTGRTLVAQNRNVAQGDNQLQFDLTNLPQGSYFVRLQSNTATTIQTIVKQ